MNNSDRIASLLSHHANKTLVRNVWHGKNKMNEETACWLGAFGKDITSASKCPAELMPEWLAELIPSFDDRVSDVKWQSFTDQYVELAQQWHMLTPEAWSRVHTETILCALNIALPRNTQSISRVIKMYELKKHGYVPKVSEWEFIRNRADYFVVSYAASIHTDIVYYTLKTIGAVALLSKNIEDIWDKTCEATFDTIQQEIELVS